ncbi:uncharacterized protein LOC109842969 isoform X2 [Asparagus officinalis]|uniref:uncharacterized protein LOC109842969 isoform X2 n=1 Tax=Asparagus officinalis TaxID=4686 RepID=UPI00098E0A34|nr:uncharacterized protein LOC109842969 isoform X2 [Asparagus officinalis]
MEAEKKKTPKAIIVGGSIAGLSCAHALISTGWEVTVIEKSISPPSGSPTGAGLSLEPQAREVINRWLGDPSILHDITLPLTIELHQAVDKEKKTSRLLLRDDNFTYRCAHWTDLHSVIYKALMPDTVLWGHRFLSLCISNDKASVVVKLEVLQTNEIKEVVADLLVAADGSLSMIRHNFIPDHKLRYSGYSAWRGVFDFEEDERSDVILGIKKAYPELGNCLYFDYANGNHCVLFELRKKRLNWIWYFDAPEPNREVGDAGHPTTPHASRSTNMSILDAEVLGLCIKKWGPENLAKALQEFQAVRHPVVSEQVLCSRRMGLLKQGLPISDDDKVFDPCTADTDDCWVIQHRNIPFYECVPTSI